ncbi:hypothetical protein [Chromobacterium sp. IIBBL 290-4]|uniref:hypothetical protein n=1 Tax=Chromobacterium sp. IIBBL 290-4 TaxID=2953890 RepID=UPI0020B74D5A|nr:hypothetical protein [Chromobacterium sp. IIBBL 290-4]UTH72537.1 hypothetical protein NKT35_13350 [Chromobacterium sp. IIBBL 290-4]
MKLIKIVLPLLVLLISGCAAAPSGDKQSEEDQNWQVPAYSLGSNIARHSDSRTTTLTDGAQQELFDQIRHASPTTPSK